MKAIKFFVAVSVLVMGLASCGGNKKSENTENQAPVAQDTLSIELSASRVINNQYYLSSVKDNQGASHEVLCVVYQNGIGVRIDDMSSEEVFTFGYWEKPKQDNALNKFQVSIVFDESGNVMPVEVNNSGAIVSLEKGAQKLVDGNTEFATVDANGILNLDGKLRRVILN